MAVNSRHIIIKGVLASLPLLVTLLLFLYPFVQSRGHNSTMTKITHINKSVYFIEGHGGNIGVLANDSGLLLIDDQFAYLHDEIKAQLNTISEENVKYVINTHWHVDHTNGNERFGQEGSIIIAHEHSAERMQSVQTIEVFNHKQMPYNEFGQAKQTFSDTLDMSFGDESIQLVHMPDAHTSGDLVVLFQQANVIHTGDIFVTYGYPFIDQPNGGTIQGVIAAVKWLLKHSNHETKFIPGHGHIASRDELASYLTMLETILDRVQINFELGASFNEILSTHPARGYSSTKINETILVDIIYNNLLDAQ